MTTWSSFLPPRLDHFVAAVAAAAAPAIDARVLRRYCRSLSRAHVAALIAAGLKGVALLRQVRIKVIENRLVDYLRAVRQISHRLRRLEYSRDIDDGPSTARSRT